MKTKKKNPQRVSSSKTAHVRKPETVKLPPKPQSQVNIKATLTESNNVVAESGSPDTSMVDSDSVPQTPKETVFDIANLSETWLDVIKPFEEQTRLYVALKTSEPVFEAPSTIKLTFKSDSQVDLVNEIKSKIENVIKQKHNLETVELEWIIDEAIDIPNEQKSGDEVFEIFAERNPSFKKLADLLNLDNGN